MSRYFRPVAQLWPVALAIVFGVVASASLATIRVKVEGGETLELMAERLYGDIRKSAVIRAANKVNEGEQPADGAFIKIPGNTIHTVSPGETMQKVADRFLSADGGAALLAEANGLAPNAAIKPGQVLSVFFELEVRTNGRSAEDIANIYLGDANLGARIRRYNGVADGAKFDWLGGCVVHRQIAGSQERRALQLPAAHGHPRDRMAFWWVVTPGLAIAKDHSQVVHR